MLYDLVLCGLVTFIIAYFFQQLDGPGDIFHKFRTRFVDNGYNQYGEATTFLAKLFSCFWCLSTWVALIVVTVYVIPTEWGNYTLLVFIRAVYMWLASIAVAFLVFAVAEK